MIKKTISLVMICSLAFLFGCASQPKATDAPKIVEQELIIDKQIQPLGRNEVISAVKDCEVNGLRAVLLYAKRKINGYTTEIVADVTCAPKYY